MKKYVKPEIFFESYELSQHIAACGYDMTNSKSVVECSATSDPTVGNVDLGDLHVFVDGNDLCTVQTEIYCYTNGAGGDQFKVFNS